MPRSLTVEEQFAEYDAINAQEDGTQQNEQNITGNEADTRPVQTQAPIIEGEEDSFNGEPEPQLESDEEIPEYNTGRASYLDDVGGFYEFGSIEEVNKTAETLGRSADLSMREIRSNGLLGGVMRALSKWAPEGMGELDSEFNAEVMYQDFNLEDAFKRDGVSLEDQELYSGCKTKRQYELTREFISESREDEELLSDGDDVTAILSFPGKAVNFLSELPLFKGVDGALGALWKAGNLSDKVTRLAKWNKFFSWLKPEVVEDLYKASGVGAIFGTMEYATKQDLSPEEAFYYGLTLSLIDGGFRLIGRAVSNKVKKEMADAILENISAEDPQKLAMSRLKQYFEEANDPKVNKFTKLTATKGLTATTPHQMICSQFKEVQDMGTALFTYNGEVFDFARWVDAEGKVVREAPAELKSRYEHQLLNNNFAKNQKVLREINSDVKKYNGMSASEWVKEGFYSHGSALPVDLPHRERIIGVCDDMWRVVKKVDDLRLEVHGEASELEASFLPAEETGKNFSIEKLVARHKTGNKGVKPEYIPQRFDREAIAKDPEEFKELLKQGLINVKASELGDELTEDALRAFENSRELKDRVESQFENILNIGFNLEDFRRGARDIDRRTVRVDPRALFKFYRKDPQELLYNWARREIGILNFEGAVKRQGYESMTEFKKAVNEKFNEAKKGLVGEAREKIELEQKNTLQIIDQAEYVMLYKYLPQDEAVKLFAANPQAVKLIEAARNMTMATALSKTFLSAWADVNGIIARYGLTGAVGSFARTLGGAFNRAFRSIAHLPKNERDKLFEALVTGIEENKIHSSLKAVPIQNDEVFYGAGKISKTPWTRSVADWAFVLTAQRAIDNGFRRMATDAILKSMLKNPARKKQIAEMIKNKAFSEEVKMEILQKIDSIVRKPTLADVPNFAYGAVGRFFNVFQSWLFSNTSNFVYPLINGRFSKRFAAEAILSGVGLTMLSEYCKEWLRGNDVDLSDEEQQEKFVNRVFDYALGDYIGAISIYYDWAKTVVTQRDIAKGISPILSYAYDNIALLSNIFNTFIGTGNPPSFYSAKRGLKAIPLSQAPGIERFVTNPLAEAWSGESMN